jgi:6,7-dimethyl-8-ribityllumazine synthase
MKVIMAKDRSKPFSVAIIVSRFNEQVTQRLYEGAIQRLKELKIPDEQITVIWVPGAVEIPIVAKQLAKSKQYKVVIALGAVVRGETHHYDFVCKQVSDGCQQIALDYNTPVIFGVLTTENMEQALDRAGGKHSHKGREAVDAAFEMVSIMQQLPV